MDSTGKAELLSTYLFDSEDFPCSTRLGLPGSNCIGGNAISWFGQQQNLYSQSQPNRDLLFMHRPLQEMMNAYNAQEVYGIKE